LVAVAITNCIVGREKESVSKKVSAISTCSVGCSRVVHKTRLVTAGADQSPSSISTQ